MWLGLAAGNRFPDALRGLVSIPLGIAGLVLAWTLAESIGTALDSAGAKAGEPSLSALCPANSPVTRDPVRPLEPRDATDAAPPSAIASSVGTFDHRALTPLHPSLKQARHSSRLVITGSGVTGTLATAPAGGFVLDDVLCMVPMQTTPDETRARIANGDSALHANSAPDTDTIVRPTASGVTVVESLRGPDAPTRFSWKLGLSPGHGLRALPNGGVAIEDRSRAAPATYSTPQEPENVDRAAAIPDGSAQLAESRYEIARAEQETGHRVLGVVSAPYSVDSDGDAASAKLRANGARTLTATSAPGAKALVMTVATEGGNKKIKAPKPVNSYPLIGISDNLSTEAANAACSFAQSQPRGRRLMLFHFGRARAEGEEFGAGRRPFHSNAEILSVLRAAADSYRQDGCHRGGRTATIAYGVTNFELSTTGNGGFPMSPPLARQVGAAQLEVARSLGSSAHAKDDTAVAGDIEPGWDPSPAGVTVGKAVVAGANTGELPYYNYGSAGNCAPYVGGNPGCGSWGFDDLGVVSQKHEAVALPQIYHAYQAEQWNKVRKRWDRRHVRKPDRCLDDRPPRCYSFAGATSEPKPCGSDLSPGQSWRALRKANPAGSVDQELIYFNPGQLNC
jgi:hypothetical protein